MKIYWIREADDAVRGPLTVDEWIAYARDHDNEISERKRVERTEVGDDVTVSTVFLGLDHNFYGGAPLIYETMIFGGECDQHQWRYSTVEQAREGHARVVAALRAGVDPSDNES